MQAARHLSRPRASQSKPRPILFILIRAALLGTLLSLALVILYAVALRQAWLVTDTMGPVTAVIKVISAALAGFLAGRSVKSRLWLWGMLGGILCSLVSFLLFSLLSQTFALNAAIFSDFGLAAAAGLFAVLIRQFFK